MFICIIVLIMTLSFISPSLVALAADSGGAGGGLEDGGGAGIHVNDDPLNDENIGLRIYLVSQKDGKSTVVKNRYSRYYLDIWMNGYVPNYNNVNSTSRYSPVASRDNITKAGAAEFDSYINAAYKKIGCSSGINFSAHMIPGISSYNNTVYWFTEAGGFAVAGTNFYNWFMGTREIKGESVPVYELVLNYLYNNCTQGLDPESSFLVVEPIVFLCNPTGSLSSNGFTTTGNRYVASWFGYITYNVKKGHDPGFAHTVRNRLQKLGNGFKLVTTKSAQAAKNRIKDVLKLDMADKDEYDCTGTDPDWFGELPDGKSGQFHRNIHETVGYGLQAYWLKGSLKGGNPIDTYNIDKKTTLTPDNAEVPSDSNNNKGSKTIVKMYVDLYQDEKTGYYTEIVDTATYARKNVSNLVSITDESKINGYNVAAWYTSKTPFDYDIDDNGKVNNYHVMGSGMMALTDFGGSNTDGTVSLSVLGGKQLRINNYHGLEYIPVGSKKYYTALSGKHGIADIYINVQSTTGATQYTNYKRLGFNGKTVYGHYAFDKNDKTDQTVDLGDDETLVVLYTRERTKLSTGDYNDPGETTITTDTNKHNDKSGNLKIVKLYGVLNPSTLEITNDPSKSKVVIKNSTRNVNLNSENGYDLAEWIYVTGGAGTGISASDMGDPSHYSYDGSADKAYRLDGFVDNFKNNPSYSRAFKFKSGDNGSLKMPSIYTLSNPDGIAENVLPGRYSIGSRSGIGSQTYNSTIYFGGDGQLSDGTPDDTDTNDVLYMLFLKTDQLSYSTDDLVIPQSYVTRYDNYKHNAMKVSGSVSGTTYNEYLQNHKFKYLLPVISKKEYVEVNPLFIGQITVKDKLQSGLISKYSAVERIEDKGANNKHEIIKGYVNSDTSYTFPDYVQLLYIDHNQAITSSHDSKPIGNILNLSAVNLEYTAYRKGDNVTAAIWKYMSIEDSVNGSMRIPTDTGVLLSDFTTGYMTSLGGSVVYQGFNKPSTTRQPNDSEQNFTLNFDFSEVGNGVKNAWITTNMPNVKTSFDTTLYGISQKGELKLGSTTLNRFNNSTGKAGLCTKQYLNEQNKRVLSQAYCAELPGDFKKYSINSLNRLYKIKLNGNWTYAVGTTQYLNSASDISITQNVKYGVHYGSEIAKENPYKDNTKTGNSTDKSRQSGYVKSMKSSNTITFYPYYTMQYELPSTYNAQLNKDGTKNNTAGAMNNANQLYVIGEQKRYLNVYNYAEVSFSGHTVSSSKGTDVVNNVVNLNRSGRIEISSEQWSTHARANSLIGLDNCALPGGATLSITIPNDNRQTVTITSYGAFLPEQSAGYAQVKAMNDASAFGTMPTNTDAIKSRHNYLVGSVVAGFEGLNVEQYFTDTKGYTNTKDHGSTYDSANTVYNQISGELGSGKNLYDLPESKRYSVTDFTGKENKYYYRPDGDVQIDKDGKTSTIKLSGFGDIELATGNNNDGKGNTGDFDTNYNDLDPNSPTSVTYYTFYMNRVGQVLCIADNNLNSSSKANLTGTTSGDGAVLVAEWSPSAEQHFNYASGLSNDVKQAAINTGIVEELYKQLQEGTGSDQFTPWGTSDGKWYFEAFDGITIAKYTTTLKVGFIDPYERTSVLDPAVVPSMQNKGDMLTSSVVSQIVTSNTSLKYGTVNKIGEFSDENGNKLGDIIMPDLRSFFISDLFFAPNITVQDLK